MGQRPPETSRLETAQHAAEQLSLASVTLRSHQSDAEWHAADLAHKMQGIALSLCVQVLHDQIVQYTDAGAATGNAVVAFEKDSLSLLAPRGRFDVEMYLSSLKLTGQVCSHSLRSMHFSRPCSNKLWYSSDSENEQKLVQSPCTHDTCCVVAS